MAHTTLETLLAERDIQQQLIRFARAMDARDWAAMAAILSDDAVADFGLGPVVGRDEVVAAIRPYLEACGPSQHLLGNFLIEVRGDSAYSETYVADLHLSKDPASELSFRTLGNYSDRWVRRDGVWLLCSRHKDNRATVGSMDVFSR